jgi:hypothetical protein
LSPGYHTPGQGGEAEAFNASNCEVVPIQNVNCGLDLYHNQFFIFCIGADMAPLANAPDALAVLDEIKAPAGVVLPPKEIKGAPLGTIKSRNVLTFISYPRKDCWLCRP